MIKIATCQGEAMRLRGTRLTLDARDYVVPFILSEQWEWWMLCNGYYGGKVVVCNSGGYCHHYHFYLRHHCGMVVVAATSSNVGIAAVVHSL